MGAAAGYAPLDAGKLDELLLAHPAFCGESTFVLEEGARSRLLPRLHGRYSRRARVRGYVSCVLLDETCDTAENTALLLGAVEESFRAKGKSVAAVTFFQSPASAVDHPRNGRPPAQQHARHSEGYPLYERMLALGYREAATEMAMYLDLAAFAYPAAMEERAAKMAAQGYTVDWYKEGVHRGVDEMVASLGNPMWDAEIPGARRHAPSSSPATRSQASPTGVPGADRPGYFAGIAVEERYRGHGSASFFYRLCRAEKECGAQYMSLFTGIDNPAQNIYKEAGFTPRRYFAVMIKELKP